MAPTVEHQVRLYRDSQAIAWGFKLQGGLEYKVPLTVQRVFVGSPADGALHRGDVLVAIDNYDASQMLHRQAMDLIKRASNSLIIRLRRAQSIKGTITAVPVAKVPGHFVSHQQNQPKQTSVTIPYRSQTFDNRPSNNKSPTKSPTRSMDHHQCGSYDDYFSDGYNNDQYMMHPVSDHSMEDLSGQFQQQSSLWGEEVGEDDPEYEQRSVSELKQLFGKHPGYSSYTLPARRTVSAPHRSFAPSYNSNTLPKKSAWHKPNSATNPAPEYLLEPGWAPKSPKGQQENPWHSNDNHVQQSARQNPSHQHQPQQKKHHHAPPYLESPPLRQYHPLHAESEQNFEQPPWSGSLKSPSGSHKKPSWDSHQSPEFEPEHYSEGGWGDHGDSQNAPWHHQQNAKQPIQLQQPKLQAQRQQANKVQQPQQAYKPQPINKAQGYLVHKPQPVNNGEPYHTSQPSRSPHQQFSKPVPVNKQPQPANRPTQQHFQQQKPISKPQPAGSNFKSSTVGSRPHEQHYNNPGGLYASPKNATQQYKPNKGQLVVTGVTPAKKSFNLAQSDVYRLVAEEQDAKKNPVQTKSYPFATYTDRDESSYADNTHSFQQSRVGGSGGLKQTPLLYELEQQYSIDETGVSDF